MRSRSREICKKYLDPNLEEDKASNLGLNSQESLKISKDPEVILDTEDKHTCLGETGIAGA